MIFTVDKRVVLSSFLHLLYSWSSIVLIAPSCSLKLLAPEQMIKSRSGFIGSGRPARTDYEILKPYILPNNIELKNPDEFSYICCGHGTLDNVMQEIQTSGEPHLVCNIPLALVANVLTSRHANEVIKEHNLYVSRKSLAEKQKAIESHVCTISCNRCVTMFKPVKKILKSVKDRKSVV